MIIRPVFNILFLPDITYFFKRDFFPGAAADQIEVGTDILFPFLGTAVTAFLTNLERMYLGKLRPYVYLYSFFITMVFVKAVHVQMQMPDTGTLCRTIGTGLILISDFLILFLYFYKNRPWPTHGWNLATYYYGMFFIAVGLLY